MIFVITINVKSPVYETGRAHASARIPSVLPVQLERETVLQSRRGWRRMPPDAWFDNRMGAFFRNAGWHCQAEAA
jgi:hypothetical protein